MSGASARYSCLHAPVETVTPPRRQKKAIPFRFPGFRKSRESSISIASFFLTNSNPLCWASSWGNEENRFLLLPYQLEPASLGFELGKRGKTMGFVFLSDPKRRGFGSVGERVRTLRI